MWTYDWHQSPVILFTIADVALDDLRAARFQVNDQDVKMIPFFSSYPEKTVMLYPQPLVRGQTYPVKIIFKNGTISEYNLTCGQRGELGGGDLGALSRLPGI